MTRRYPVDALPEDRRAQLVQALADVLVADHRAQPEALAERRVPTPSRLPRQRGIRRTTQHASRA